jgi:predicted MFS family arabinose efflux permease
MLAWASSIYLPAVLAKPIGVELGIGNSEVFAAFSLALMVMALCAPSIGRLIDRHGGRGVLSLSNVVLAAGLIVLGMANSSAMLFGAWSVIGAGMALGLYDAAFATLVRLHGLSARGSITGITLLGGLASTIGWPLTATIDAHFGWRAACFFWAALQIGVALPLHRFSIPSSPGRGNGPTLATDESHMKSRTKDSASARRTLLLLAVFGAATAFVTSALAAHFPRLLLLGGVTPVEAIQAAACVGIAQVGARLFELLAGRHFRLNPLRIAQFATLLNPLGATAILLFGGSLFSAILFAILHGAGNGLITIAKGTVPLVLFGPGGYGARQGLLAIAQRFMQAAAPVTFALVMDSGGASAALLLCSGLSLFAAVALFCIRAAENNVNESKVLA